VTYLHIQLEGHARVRGSSSADFVTQCKRDYGLHPPGHLKGWPAQAEFGHLLADVLLRPSCGR
jgi:hypothetical protein